SAFRKPRAKPALVRLDRRDTDVLKKLHDLRRYRRLGLTGNRDIPVFRLRQAFLEVAGRRGRVRGVTAGNDEGGSVETAPVLGRAAGRGVPVEHPAGHAANEQFVSVDVLLRIHGGEPAVVLDARSPWPASGIGAERLALFGRQIDDRLEAVL